MKNLIEALQAIAGETASELIKTLLSPFFQQLMVCVSDGIGWAVETGRARQHQRGITIADWALTGLHTTLGDSFIAKLKRQNDCRSDDARAITQIRETVARLLEAERRPMTLVDLTAPEHLFIEEWAGYLIERPMRLAEEDDVEGTPSVRLLPTLNFIIWWGRHQGKLPRWFRPTYRVAA